jgi:DNA adenine methylase
MNSPLCYVGGKSQLRDKICSLIPEHATYCEGFVGAGWVFFHKEPSRYETLNDLDGDLISLYRVVQNHLEEFIKQFKWLLSSRQWWEEWNRQQEAGGLTDIQRAARYYYIQRHAFGGKVGGRTFAASQERPPRINLLRLEEEMSAMHLRMARVTVENLDWKVLVQRYDRPATFFYLDPPYYKAPVYKHNFLKLEDYSGMADTLASIKGKFLLSINDLPEIRQVFKRFKIEGTSVRYSVNSKKPLVAKELLVRNY